MKPRSFLHLLILAVFLLAASIAVAGDTLPKAEPAPTPKTDSPKTDSQKTAPPATGAPDALDTEDEVWHWTGSLFYDGEFATLEKTAAAWRADKSAFPSGTWKLTVLYNGISDGFSTALDQKRWIKSAWRWARQSPRSITARIVLAEMLCEYAWKGRGEETKFKAGAKVTPAQLKEFNARLVEALAVLKDAEKLEEKCPQWWSAMQYIAHSQGATDADFNALINRALAAYPEYYTYYANRQFYLLPQWYGKAGMAHQYALNAANRRGGAAGALLYARLINQLSRFKPPQVAWDKVDFAKLDNGFATLAQRFPKDFYWQTRRIWVCRFTATAKTQAAHQAHARRLFAQLEKTHPERRNEWLEGRYSNLYKWAYGTGPDGKTATLQSAGDGSGGAG